MIQSPIIRQLLNDRETLRQYDTMEYDSVSHKDVKRRIFLQERLTNTALPDHYYHRAAEKLLTGYDSLSKLISKALVDMADRYLYVRGDIVYVKRERFSEWQDIITLIPPSLLVAGILWKSLDGHIFKDFESIKQILNDQIKPNIQHTCLPSPSFAHLDSFIEENGLYDLHMHLNGSTEIDTIWQSYLKYPEEVSKNFEEVAHKEKVKEQLEQEDSCFTPKKLYDRLMVAYRIRRCLVKCIFDVKPDQKCESMDVFSRKHPLTCFLCGCEKGWSEQCLEVMMYMLLFQKLSNKENEKLAKLFHHYLLILGFVNRFVVQQLHQNGFDQFQKITLNNFRDKPEEKYVKRFYQLSGKSNKDVIFFEGRFAPKGSVDDNFTLINKVEKGWDKYKGTKEIDLTLVAHFIKDKDPQCLEEKFNETVIRHSELRKSLWDKANALSITLQHPYSKKIAGIDAASNELEAPPEVFAPIYRYIRRAGINHFTYHAGEDFHHIVGGLRAMFEAAKFLDLRCGDRIGHGTAMGISPELWYRNVGDHLYMSIGEWLDDLVFAFYLISKSSDDDLHTLIPKISYEIEKLSSEVYGKSYSVSLHIKAWLAREWCPFHLLEDDKLGAYQLPVWCEKEWELAKNFELTDDAKELVEKYHFGKYRKKYHEKQQIETKNIFSLNHTYKLQNILQEYILKREIVLEVLPTSNVRISFYKDYAEHHIWRWLGLDGMNSEELPIVLGTDDAGIFATNIRNEYSHIYNNLINEKGLSPAKAIDVIGRIHKNSQVYAFR